MGTTATDQAFLTQLNNSYSEYIQAKTKFEITRVECETARAKFRGMCDLAPDLTSPMGWWNWKQTHKDVRFLNLSIGDAILELLRAHATQRAWDVVEGGHKKYQPHMSIAQIAEGLDAGGFEFKSATIRREVNAALMQLKGVDRSKPALFAIEDANDILKGVESSVCATETVEQAEEE